MSERQRKKAGATLPLVDQRVRAPQYYWTSSLFNEVYLQNDVPKAHTDWHIDEAGPFHDFLQNFINLSTDLRNEAFETWNEAQTVKDWIIPVMTLLGWNDKCRGSTNPVMDNLSYSIPENGKTRSYRPDLVYVDDPKEKAFLNPDEPLKKLRAGRTFCKMVVEAKSWRRLDILSKEIAKKEGTKAGEKDDDTRYLTPEEQCLKYMSLLQRPYGFLTDGNRWRLLHSELSEGSNPRCFEFNLGYARNTILKLHEDKENEEWKKLLTNLKYFFYFFSKAAFYPQNGSTPFVDDVLEYSKKYAHRIEDDLKASFISAMTVICNGYKQSMGQKFNNDSLDLIRNVSESHLFNILFIKSCEVRNVLPLKNPDYLRQSLTEIIDSIEYPRYVPEADDDLNEKRLQEAFSHAFKYSNEGTEIYDRLMKLYSIVQEGDFGLEIVGFKETVFAEKELSFARKTKISNKCMVQLLFSLGYTASEVATREYQQIPYNYFTPRQLGSIYESFLEFELIEAKEDKVYHKKKWSPANLKSDIVRTKFRKCPKARKNSLYFAIDDEKRQDSGSYYTPDHVVRYIVQETLSPLIEGKSSKEIMDLKVCDPAMGSGHFLNVALEYLTYAYREAWAIENHDDVVEAFPETAQKVLHACILGTDLNDRAVKLSKMGLWLTTAHSNKKLEPLNDQIFWGDSLLEKQSDKVPTFSWKDSLGSAFGKVSAIVGNPPYIRSAKIEPEARELLRARYKTATSAYDVFVIFFEVAASLLKDDGRLGFIVSNKLAVADYAKECRRQLINEWTMEQLIDFTRCDRVFPDASVVPMIVIGSKKAPSNPDKVVLRRAVPENEGPKAFPHGLEEVKVEEIVGNNLNLELFHTAFSKKLIEKVGKNSKALHQLETVRTGIMGFEYWKHSKFLDEGGKLAKTKHWKLITPGLMTRFANLWDEKTIRLYKKKVSRPLLLRTNSLLSENTRSLFDNHKVVIRGVGRGIAAFLDEEGMALLVAVHCIENPKYPHFYEALFNSSLVNWLYCTTMLAGKIPQGSLKFPITFIESIPVREDGLEATDKKIRAIRKAAKGDFQQEIDELVSKQYGISAQEMKAMREEVLKTLPDAYSFNADDDEEDAT